MTELARAACDVLIVAAHPVELAPLRAALGGESAARGALRVATQQVGVGIALAGSGTAAALAAAPARAVVLLGSFGAYPYASASGRLGCLLLPDDTALIDVSLLGERAAAPAAMPVRARADQELRAGLSRANPDALGGTLATTAFITTDDALASTLARSGCVGENLEAVAVGLACEARGVPWAALLGCTNDVGSVGRAQWLAGHARAAAEASTAVLRWLDAGAPGVLTAGGR